VRSNQEDMSSAFLYFALFIGICISRGAKGFHSSHTTRELFRDSGKEIVSQLGVQGCSVSATANTTNNIESLLTWVPRLIIVSQVVVPQGQLLTSVAFVPLVNSLNSTNSGLVDIVIYNSTITGAPGFLQAKFSAVNLSRFVNRTFNCLPLNNIGNSANGVYWIGFYGATGYGPTVIAKALTRSGGIDSKYQFISSSPSIGQSFPSQSSTEEGQLVMGLNYGQQGFCSVSASANTSAILAPFLAWVPRVIVVSQVVVPPNQALISLGFYPLTVPSNSSISGLVDILIYNSSNMNGNPGFLQAKISAVNLSTFVNATYNCLSINSVISSTNGIFWIGFYGASGSASSAIASTITNSGLNFVYSFINSSPSIGSSFPTQSFSSDPHQLIMGLNYAQ